MPTYVYRCEECATTFEAQQTVSAHNVAHSICPKCSNAKVTGVVSGLYARTARKQLRPDDVDAGRIEATLRKGLLEVCHTKNPASASSGRKIETNAG